MGEMFGDRGGVARQGRFILRGFAGEEAVEILEAIAGRPIIERPLGRDLLFGRVVPFAPGTGVVAVVLEHFGDRRRRLRDDAAEAVEVVGDRRDLAVADARVIAPGEQRRPRGRAHGGGVEAIEGDAHLRHAIERRRVDLAAVSRGRARPDIVHEDDEDVRRAIGQALRLDAFLVDGILHRQPRSGGGRRGWEGQDFLRPAVGANTAPARGTRTANGVWFHGANTCQLRMGQNCIRSDAQPSGRLTISCRRSLAGAPGFVRASMAWSMVKLAGFCRGGKSLKVISVLPTMFWTGTAMNARRYHQSL